MKASVGRIVHFTATKDSPCQAAVIVKAWSDDMVNLVVFRDGSNDRSDGLLVQEPAQTQAWVTSVAQGEGTESSRGWHEPERI